MRVYTHKHTFNVLEERFQKQVTWKNINFSHKFDIYHTNSFYYVLSQLCANIFYSQPYISHKILPWPLGLTADILIINVIDFCGLHFFFQFVLKIFLLNFETQKYLCNQVWNCDPQFAHNCPKLIVSLITTYEFPK